MPPRPDANRRDLASNWAGWTQHLSTDAVAERAATKRAVRSPPPYASSQVEQTRSRLADVAEFPDPAPLGSSAAAV